MAKKKIKRKATKKIAKKKKKPAAKKKPSARKKRPAARAKRAGKSKDAKSGTVKTRKAKKIRPIDQPGLAGLQQIGEITHYFPHVNAGVIDMKTGPLNIGDTIFIKGHTTDIKQTVTSMQIDRTPIKEAKPGDIIGLLVKGRVRIGDKVFKA